MPYKLNQAKVESLEPAAFSEFTILQQRAINYLKTTTNRWVDAREIALYYGYPSGIYFRGVLASLHQKGLLDKLEQ